MNTLKYIYIYVKYPYSYHDHFDKNESAEFFRRCPHLGQSSFFSLLKKLQQIPNLVSHNLNAVHVSLRLQYLYTAPEKKTCFQDLIDSLLVAYLEQNSVLFFGQKNRTENASPFFWFPLNYFGPFCPGLLEVCDEKNVLSGPTGGDRTVCYVGSEKLRIMGIFRMSF